MYYSNLDEKYNQGDFELLPNERISEVWAEDFERYFDRWIRYWPKNTRSGYYQKLAYDTPFFLPKSKKNADVNRHLWGDFLVEQVERHLDGQHWKYRKEAKQYTPVKQSQFWLGLNMPKKTTVSCIDPDAKQYLLGYYHMGDDDPLRPVVHLPLEHFQRLKLIYDHFPGRVWCISSATLGMHVWLKYSRSIISEQVHKGTKAELERIGLKELEVHPMPGRCLRRPFGQDYATITSEGVLTTWQSQSTFFEFVAETPPFDVIARTLLAKVQEQWRLWRDCGDAKKKTDPRKVIAQHQHEIEEVERWLDQGYPMSRFINADCPTRNQQTPVADAAALAHWIDAGCMNDTIPFSAISGKNTARKPADATSPESSIAVGSFDLESLRNGNWVKGLRDIAINGLLCPKSLHIVCYELAKWLYWVELYKQPDSETIIYRLLSTFVTRKHNGHCQRITDGNMGSIEQDLKNTIKSAKKLDPSHRMESLEIFTRLRQKRSLGQYKEVINLAPLLEGAIVASSSSSSGLLICVSTLETPLPRAIQDQITKKAGRNKVMNFATRLINLLDEHRGSCRLHQDKLMELLGYPNKNRVTKYMNILISAEVVKKGKFYQKAKASRLYTLSKDVMSLLHDARVKKEQVA